MLTLPLLLLGCFSSQSPAATTSPEFLLDEPIVMGGISDEDIDAGLSAQRSAIAGCYDAGTGLSGSVMVKFLIARDGTVSEATTRTTTLHHEATEACLNEAVAQATFPALTRGDRAIVHYVFRFPPE